MNGDNLLDAIMKAMGTIKMAKRILKYIVFFLLFFILFIVVIVFTLPHSGAEQYDRINEEGKNLEYISTADFFGFDWQLLMATDITRYGNDLSKVNPLDTMLELTTMTEYIKIITMIYDSEGKLIAKYESETTEVFRGDAIPDALSRITKQSIPYTAEKISKALETLPEKYTLYESEENGNTKVEKYRKIETDFLNEEEIIEKYFKDDEDIINKFSITYSSGVLESYINDYVEHDIDITPDLERQIDAMNFTVPMNNVRCNSPYGERVHPIKHKIIKHMGMDFVPVSGSDHRVFSSGEGVVDSINRSTARGIYVKIRHTTKDGRTIYTIYQHLKQASCKPGQQVTQQTVIGIMGRTGQVTGPHLHFEMWANNKASSAFNPATLLK